MSDRMRAIAAAIQKRLFIELEASGRHVHLTEQDAQTLFGHGLTPLRPLSQPGQFVCKERVTLIGEKASLTRVAVLGPVRKESQVEISKTDAALLGISAPVRLSGDIAGSPGIRIRGEQGEIQLSTGVIIAKRHIHMTPADAARFHLKNGDEVRCKLFSDRPTVFEGVCVRVSPDFATRVHLDFDEANAAGYHKGNQGMIFS